MGRIRKRIKTRARHLFVGFLALLCFSFDTAAGEPPLTTAEEFFEYPGVLDAVEVLADSSITFVFDVSNTSETCKGTIQAGMFYPSDKEGLLVLCNKYGSKIEMLVGMVFEHEMSHAIQWCSARDRSYFISPMGYRINNYGYANTSGRPDIGGKVVFMIEAEADSMAYDLSLKQITARLKGACSR